MMLHRVQVAAGHGVRSEGLQQCRTGNAGEAKVCDVIDLQ